MMLPLWWDHDVGTTALEIQYSSQMIFEGNFFLGWLPHSFVLPFEASLLYELMVVGQVGSLGTALFSCCVFKLLPY